MPILFTVNYSSELPRFVREGRVKIDGVEVGTYNIPRIRFASCGRNCLLTRFIFTPIAWEFYRERCLF